jgi:hypothetical protein
MGEKSDELEDLKSRISNLEKYAMMIVEKKFCDMGERLLELIKCNSEQIDKMLELSHVNNEIKQIDSIIHNNLKNSDLNKGLYI